MRERPGLAAPSGGLLLLDGAMQCAPHLVLRGPGARCMPAQDAAGCGRGQPPAGHPLLLRRAPHRLQRAPPRHAVRAAFHRLPNTVACSALASRRPFCTLGLQVDPPGVCLSADKEPCCITRGRCAADQAPQKFDKERAGILCNLSELVVRELEATWAAEYQKRCLCFRGCLATAGCWKALHGVPEHVCMAAHGSCMPGQEVSGWRMMYRGSADARRGAACRHSHKLQRAMTCYTEPFMFVDTAAPGWRIMHINDALTVRTGVQST